MEIKKYKLLMVRDSGVKIPEYTIDSPSAVVEILKVYYAGADREIFTVLALNIQNRVIGINTAHIGLLDRADIHPREIFKFAILANAAGIIIAHNHPSSNLTPSKDDLKVTKRIIEAGELMGIEVLDHLIISEDGHRSIKYSNPELWKI